ncbi:exopolysaccharide biosynthesis polyprenyl glycosylphosphotransferase [Myxococcota bacterium]|nr:exopolysaccharide biosynthesis polyprenyl glycosylphosphotransferase [Myxococcota bacterium]
MYYLNGVYSPRSICAAIVDGACVVAAFAITWAVGHPPFAPAPYLLAAGLTVLLTLGVLFFNEAYRPETLGDGQRTLVSILVTMGMGFAAALLCYFAVPLPHGATPMMASIAAIMFPLLVAARMFLRLSLGTRLLTINVVVIGATDLGLRVARMLQERSDTGIRMLGFLTDDRALHQHGGSYAGFRVLGRPHELEKVMLDWDIDHIVVASKDRHEHFPADTLMLSKTRGIHVESGLSFLERLSGRVHMRDLRSSYLIFGPGFSCGPTYRVTRRALDVVGASLLLLLASPVLALTALAIKLDSPGPVLFRQRRLGKDDKPFMMNKLRSMCDHAESKSGAVFTAENDDRITRVGYFIRRTRLDELPQLWNVLVGDMSLVGPRAERPEFAETLREIYPYYALRTTVRPGVTGWAQTRYGYVNSVEGYEEKLALDLYYLKYRSLFIDLVILAQTVKTVLHFRGM